jgi:hypothetical protein
VEGEVTTSRAIPWVLLLLATTACACVVEPVVKDVGVSFSVKIQHDAKPIEGIRVVLSDGKGELLSDVTGNDGVARFSSLPEGWLTLSVQSNDSSMQMHVQREIPEDRIVDIEWPMARLFMAQRVAGQLRSGLYVQEVPRSQPLKYISVSLTNAVTGKLVATLKTDGNGNFAFPVVPPGYYFVHVEAKKGQTTSWMPERGNIFVEVGPSGNHGASLGVLYTHMTSCGLMAGAQRDKEL